MKKIHDSDIYNLSTDICVYCLWLIECIAFTLYHLLFYFYLYSVQERYYLYMIYALVTQRKKWATPFSRPNNETHFQAWAVPSNLINLEFNVNLGVMCQDGPRMRLCPTWAWPARLPGNSQAIPRPLPGHACLPATSEKVGPTKQDFSIDGGQVTLGWGTGRAQVCDGPLLGPSHARCFDEREKILWENMAQDLWREILI